MASRSIRMGRRRTLASVHACLFILKTAVGIHRRKQRERRDSNFARQSPAIRTHPVSEVRETEKILPDPSHVVSFVTFCSNQLLLSGSVFAAQCHGAYPSSIVLFHQSVCRLEPVGTRLRAVLLVIHSGVGQRLDLRAELHVDIGVLVPTH